MITGNRVNKFSTFAERMELFKRFDRLTSDQKQIALYKHQGSMSIVMNEPIYWTEWEKFIEIYENAQVSMFPIVTDAVSGILENITPKELDKIL